MRRGRGRLLAIVAVVVIVGVGGLIIATQPSIRAALGLATVLYANPVLDRDFPDPAVLRASDGSWYAYATQTIRPRTAT